MTKITPARRAARAPTSAWLTEPHWQPACRRTVQWPSRLQPWLLDQGSLTAKLLKASGQDFDVQVLFQAVARPKPSERAALGLGNSHWALVREVVLWGRGQPWVFARSLIPVTSLTGRLRRLRRLDNRPLGAFLFGQPHLIRGTMEVSRILTQCQYVPQPLQQDQPLWGRRSVFWLEAKPLLVSEVFLPAFVQPLCSGDLTQ